MKSMLKYLAFFCSLLLSSLANKTYSQTFTTPNNSFGTNSHRFAPDSTLYFPTGCGIPTDTLSLFSQGFGGKGEKKKMAAKYYDSCGHKEYTWDPSSKAWHQSDGGGGGGGTVTTTNSVTGDGTGGTPVKLVNDAATPGNLKYYGTNSSGTKGYGDLSALIKNIGNSDLTLSSNRALDAVGQKLSFLNMSDFLVSVSTGHQLYVTDSSQRTQISIGPGCCFGTYMQRGSDIVSSDPFTGQVFGTIGLDSGQAYWSDQFGNEIVYAGPTTGTPGITMAPLGGNLTIYSLPSTTDTTKKSLVYDPVSQTVSYMDLWSRAAGGGNPFADNTALVKNNSDNTKKVIIGAANVSTATTRILQSPDANGTIVLNDNTATLTNKTIAAGSNTISGLTNSNLSGSAAITNANLANSSITINGINTALGTSVTVSGTSYSVSTAPNTSNYSVPTGRKIFVTLSDLTGQANRNAVLPGSPVTGDEAVFKNINTSTSTFNWAFTVGTVKDFGNNSITTLANLTVYHLVFDGTNWDIIN